MALNFKKRLFLTLSRRPGGIAIPFSLFYGKFGIANAERIGETLRGLKPIGAELMEMQVDHRGF
jgi:hypothetical protein